MARALATVVSGVAVITRTRPSILRQGAITYSHPAAAGVVDTPGAAAVVEVGDISVIVHTRPVRVIDPAIYLALDIDISQQRLIQAKSHVSYRAGFDAISTGSVLADTGGPTAGNLAALPFTRRPIPLYPFEDVTWTPDATRQGPAPRAPDVSA